MAKKDPNEDDTPEVEESAGSSSAGGLASKSIMGMSLPVFLVVVLNLITMLGGAGYIYYMKNVYKSPLIIEQEELAKIQAAAKKEREARLAVDGQVRILRLPEMSVNLRTQVGGKDHYVSFSLALECNNEACMEELHKFRVRIEDEVQSIVAERSFNELSMGEAIYRLKHDVTKRVNSVIREGTVTDTYFYSYLIQ